MEENKTTLGNETANEMVGNDGETTTPKSESLETLETKTTKTTEKSFSQSELDEIIGKRLNKLYSKYGVKNQEELDTLIGKAQQRDVYKETNDTLLSENKELKERLMFIGSDIDKDKYDDVKAYFKGKELELNNENLANALTTHPEWLRKVKSVEPIGNEEKGNTNTEVSEKELAKKIFGIDGFVN